MTFPKDNISFLYREYKGNISAGDKSSGCIQCSKLRFLEKSSGNSLQLHNGSKRKIVSHI